MHVLCGGQMEEAMGHSFRASTIRDMELTLLKALRWRLACVTPFSFLPVTTTTTTTRALLLRSLLDPSFLRFDDSLLAASALTLSSTTPQHPNHLLLNRLIHPFSQTVRTLINFLPYIYFNNILPICYYYFCVRDSSFTAQVAICKCWTTLFTYSHPTVMLCYNIVNRTLATLFICIFSFYDANLG